MRIAFIFQGRLHWLTPYKSLTEVPEHPETDLYVEVHNPDAQEGWLFDPMTGEFSLPPEPITPPDYFAFLDGLMEGLQNGL